MLKLLICPVIELLKVRARSHVRNSFSSMFEVCFKAISGERIRKRENKTTWRLAVAVEPYGVVNVMTERRVVELQEERLNIVH